MAQQNQEGNGHGTPAFGGLPDPLVANQLQRMVGMVENAIRSRTELWQSTLDPRRSIDHECGYPSTISAQNYHDMYKRFGVAARVVELMPHESWSSTPTIYETEEVEKTTAFEEAWDALSQQLLGRNWYHGEEGNPIWEALRRADVLSKIGSYGVMLLGLNDGLPMSEPAAGVEEKGSLPGKPDKKGEIPTPTSEQVQNAGPYGLTINAEATKGRELLYLRSFEEVQLLIGSYESNPTSSRYGQPLRYQVTFGEQSPSDWTGEMPPSQTFQVHWSRCIHLADSLGSSEILGMPAMQSVFNHLMSLQKIYGADGEAYWRNAMLKLFFETHPQLGGDVQVDVAGMRGDMEKMANGLQQWMLLKGMSAKPVAPQVIDPMSHVNAHIEAICIKLGVPKRIFVGSERGELSSSQDAGTWNDRLRDRQNRYLTPRVVVPFINRLISLGVLPQPEEYTVVWPDLAAMSDAEKATVAVQKTEAMAKYVGGQVQSLLTPIDYLTRVLDFPVEEAEEILTRATEEAEEAAEETAIQQAEEAEQAAAAMAAAGVELGTPPGAPPGASGQPFPPKGGPPQPKGGPPKPGGGKPGGPPFPPTPKDKDKDKDKDAKKKKPTGNSALLNEQPRDAQGRFGSGGGGGGGGTILKDAKEGKFDGKPANPDRADSLE